MYVMVALVLAAQLAEAGVGQEPSASHSAPPGQAISPGALSSVDAAVDEVMYRAVDAVRVALPPVVDADAARGKAVEQRLLRALADRGREEIVTPAMVQRVLGEGAASSLDGSAPKAFASLAADHVLLASVDEAAGAIRLSLKLLHVESGRVLGESSAALDASTLASSVRPRTVRRGVELAVDQLVEVLGRLPGNLRYQRVAVAPLEAQGEAVSGSRVERYIQAELGEGLRRRGYLVVERAQLASAIEQLSLGAALGESDAPTLGRMLDAQALVFGSVAEAGDAFVLSLRVVSTEGGAVLGAADAQLPREGVITLASDAIETRTAGEAFFRSLVAPGWGQFYNRQSVKGAAFGVATYGAALVTVGLGVSSAVVASLYQSYTPEPGTPPFEAGKQAKDLRGQANALLATTALSGGVTALLWGAGAVDALLDGLAYE